MELPLTKKCETDAGFSKTLSVAAQRGRRRETDGGAIGKGDLDQQVLPDVEHLR